MKKDRKRLVCYLALHAYHAMTKRNKSQIKKKQAEREEGNMNPKKPIGNGLKLINEERAEL